MVSISPRSHKQQKLKSDKAVFDYFVLMLMWGSVFIASIYEIGYFAAVFFILTNVYLVSRDPLNGILVLILIFFTPASALKIIVGPFALSTAILIAFYFFGKNSGAPLLRRLSYGEMWIFAFVICCAFSILYAPDLTLALKYFQKVLEGLVIVFITYSVVRNPEDARKLFRWMATFAGLSFFIRLAHTLYGTDTALFNQLDVVDVGSEFSLDHRLSINIGGEQAIRFLWPGEEPNYTSANMIFAFGAALALYGADRSALKYFWMLMASLVGLVIVGTFSRSGFLAVALVLVMFVCRSGVKAIPALIITVVVFAYTLLANDVLMERILSIGSEVSEGGSGRYLLWENAIDMWGNSPLFGSGLSAYLFTYREAAHNTYIQVLTELGLVGAMLYVTVLLIFITSPWRTKTYTGSDGFENRSFAVALIPGLFGMCAMIATVTYHDVKLLWFVGALSSISSVSFKKAKVV